VRGLSLLATLLIALGLAACGGEEAGEEGETNVLIETDSGPSGLAGLRAPDPESGKQNQRVPITKEGVPTSIYAVKLDELEAGVRVGGIATVTLTKCAITDYHPNARGYTACEGTKVYDYDPVEIESSFRLVGGGGSPDLSDEGAEIGDSVSTTCTTAIHHCTIAQEGIDEISSGDVPSGGEGWLIYEVSAKAPKAASCNERTPRKCNVLAVEAQKGTAMYGVRVKGEPVSRTDLPTDTSPATKQLRVLIDRGDKNDVRDVVYSVPIASEKGLADVEGDQLVIEARLIVDEKLPQAPDIANYLVLSDKPGSITGRYLISDSYNPGKTGNNGENCDKSCDFTRPAAVTTILKCDVAAGRRFINFVADGSRARAKRGEHVQIQDGGYLKVSEYFLADETSDKQSVGNCYR
jgi:hypothetical protein